MLTCRQDRRTTRPPLPVVSSSGTLIARTFLRLRLFRQCASGKSVRGVIPNDILTEVTGPGIVHTTIEQWKQFMDDGAVFKILVDRLDMMTVGVAMARISTSPDAPTPWEVATLHVLPEARNCGASDDLLNACIGHRSAYVWVFADNARAIKFYERHGFHVDDTDGAVDDSLGGVELQRLIREDAIEAK